MESIDIKMMATIVHLLGVTVGAGGSFLSDVLFVTTTKDKVLDASEMRVLRRGSLVTWVGLLIIGISGLVLVSLDPASYLGASKFWLKMSIVGIITINGFIFHLVHLPRLHRLVNQHLASHPLFIKSSLFMYISGAISMVSWVSALVLGALRSVTVPFLSGFGVYLAIVFVGIIAALIQRRRYLKISRS